MRIGVLVRRDEPFSFRNYRENLEVALAARGVAHEPFPPRGPAPGDCDLVWDPGLGMGRVPSALLRADPPVIATVHGLRAFSLPAAEIASGVLERAQLALARFRRTREWRRFAPRAARIIAVSEFGAGEVAAAFDVPRAKIRAIHHGVAHELFRPDGEARRAPRPYFLHVSSYQRKKNLERMLAAWARLPAERPDLALVVPGYAGAPPDVPGVTLWREPFSHAELAPWYRGALAFVFPSLHETFGMPILEAMACGCPVVTANATACPEVAGDAALLVDPRSVDALEGALRQLAGEPGLRAELRERGLARARGFDWGTCAERHLALFEEALRERS